MDIHSYEEGVPSWVTLTTPDAEGGSRFYGSLFGWAYQEGPGGPGGPHPSWTALLHERPVAAIAPAEGAERATWSMHVNVADADKTAETVIAAGGRVLTPPYDLGATGRAAVFADHSGTTFAVWQAGGHPGAGAVDEPGAFHRGELITDDVEASRDFYHSVFGWTLTPPEGPLSRRTWQLNGRAVAELLPRPPAMPVEIPPYWDIYFTVGDAEAAITAVTALGGTVLMGATPLAHGTIAVFADPAGAVFTVNAPATSTN
ncbi:VOC family protein [Streptomyces sp. NPDC051576]|uniref:VOC family protein n=1 Tax=Streptomyces sp. NPDC051576 TaxID=3155803 RepID=UPI00343C31E6